MPFVRDSLIDKEHLFLGLSETWLHSQKESEYTVEGYTFFGVNSPRIKKSRGRFCGGVGLFVRDDISCSCEPILKYATNAVQIVCLFSKKENLVFASIYRTPDDSAHGNRSTSADLKPAIDRLSEILNSYTPMPDIVIGGDFNLPNAHWRSGSPKDGTPADERGMLNILNEFCTTFSLHQLVTESTHRCGNVLDLVFVNNLDLVHRCAVIPTLNSISDHAMVTVSTSYKAPAEHETVTPKLSKFDHLNFYSSDVDWCSINDELLEYDWQIEFCNKTNSEKLNSFYSVLYEICSKFVPKRKGPANKAKSKAQRLRQNLTRRRRRVRKLIINCSSPSRKARLNAELIDIEKQLQKSFRQSTTFQEKKAVAAIKDNPKYFFSYVKKKSKVKTKIGPLMNKDGEMTNDSKTMADLLASQYDSMFSVPCADPQVNMPTVNSNLGDFLFSEYDIESAIDTLKKNSASGPDGIPAILLKMCKYSLSSPLFILWKTFFDSGCIPDILKLGIIIPQHKGGNKSRPANYRPISLTSHLMKIFEKVVKSSVIAYLDEHNLFNNGQDGFRAKRSCLSQLLEHFYTVLECLENGANVDVVYLDFAKAFDKVDIGIALEKLRSLGIFGKLLTFFECFLRNRHQAVCVNGVLSDHRPVISGVPQGSVLGPLIFLVMLSDIDKDVKYSFVSSFADDTRLLKRIVHYIDISLMQEDLTSIYEWSDKSNSMLNGEKFECIRLGPDIEIKSTTSYLTPDSKAIKAKSEVKDLGILMSASASFKPHIEAMVANAKSTVGWILRSFESRAQDSMLTLWKSLVRSLLEYCCVLWSPQQTGLIQMIECLQWSFIRKIRAGVHRNYWDALKHLKLYSLQRRRERYQIIYVWSILESIRPNVRNAITSQMHVRFGRKCIIPPNRNLSDRLSNIRESLLPIHGSKLFNCLPQGLRNMTGVGIDV